MCSRKRKNKVSSLIVLRSEEIGKYYVGTVQLGFDGFIEPCQQLSEFFDTIEQANAELRNYE